MPGWKTSSRRMTLPADWPTIRPRILRRDNHECQRIINGTKCGKRANQVDHKDPNGGDSDDNLESLCRSHHAVKSSSEGGRARWAKRKKRQREEPPHPGLIDPPKRRRRA